MLVQFFRKRTALGSAVVFLGIGLYLAVVFLVVDWAMIRRHPPPPASQSQSD